MLALLTRSLGQKDARSGLIRSPYPEGRKQQVVSTLQKCARALRGCQSLVSRTREDTNPVFRTLFAQFGFACCSFNRYGEQTSDARANPRGAGAPPAVFQTSSADA